MIDLTSNPAPDMHALSAEIERHITEHLKLTDKNTTDLYPLFLAQLERPLLIATLKHTRGNQSKTAKMLGINRGTLRTKLKQYGLLWIHQIGNRYAYLSPMPKTTQKNSKNHPKTRITPL